ncbi:tetratricopeptide repeat protein [Streptomyces sp. P1-3]|uniref:tetratricopeptide repeat protein n=1 Tax=Streptomyces sp. P1-3 TaxID=3421658 RepID=UPI003D36E5CD
MTQHVRAENGFAYGAVGADIHVFGDGVPVYLLQRWRASAPPDDGFLREMPSRMLNARFGVVEFTGRSAELGALRRWRDDGARLAVRWLHAPGGQGKTRLADRFAQESAADGWQVVTATHGPGSVLPPPGSQDLGAAADARTLLIVDYADRWPLSHLLWLFSNALLHRPAGRARVLLLARSDDVWPAVRAALANQQAATSAQFLPPLPGASGEGDGAGEAGTESPRTEMFTAARDSFAVRYGIPSVGITAPETLTSADFGLTLAVHMAALVAVDARAAGRRPPPDLAGLTSYLLDREHLHWARLYGDAGDADHEIAPSAKAFRTPPEVMNRTVFTAALTGPLAPAKGRDVVGGMGLGLPAGRVLADHAVCYPRADPDQDTVLEPLYPDRLSEDFLALTLPGHRAEYPAQPWAGPVVDTLLTGSVADSWTPRAVTFLVAAAERWPHIGPRYLYPLLTAAPRLAVAGGSGVLSALAALDGIAPELLEAVAAHFPSSQRPDVDLDPGIAAVSVRLLPHRLAAAGHPGDQAAERHRLSILLHHAGRLEEAVAESGAAVEQYRVIDPDGMPTPALAVAVQRNLAVGLKAHGVRLAAVGRRAEALAVTEESVDILRGLAERDRRFLPDLASALLNVGRGLTLADRWDEATAATRECVALHQELAAADPAAHESDLAASLVALGLCLGRTGRPEEAVTATREGVSILRRLARAEPAAYTPALANALTNLAAALARTGGRDAVPAGREAAALYRRLATANPASYESQLANVLSGLGLRLLMAGQPDEAVAAAHESVTILRRLAERRPEAHGHFLAEAQGALSTVLLATGRLDDALAAADECVAVRRRMAAADPGVMPKLAHALLNATGIRAEAGGSRLTEAVHLFIEATGVCGRRDAIAAGVGGLHQAVGSRLADRLAAEGRPDAADRIRRAVTGLSP